VRSNEIALVSIAVVVIGIFALPSTVSLFGGQHKWYDLGGKGNEVPCEKCHADTAAEMESQIGPHTGETGYGRMKCVYCHRLFPIEHKNASFDTYAYASGDGTGAEPGKEAHAASTVACMYCHSGEEAGIVAPQATTWHDNESDCLRCHAGPGKGHGEAHVFETEDCYKCHLYKNESGSIVTLRIPPAGGFGLTTNTSDTGETAAHKAFVMDAIDDPLMEDANEACIACHTYVAIDINWTHAYKMYFEADGRGGVWNVANFDSEGCYNTTTYGNMSGNITGVSEPIVKWPNGSIVTNP
jgi:hypothetical protein